VRVDDWCRHGFGRALRMPPADMAQTTAAISRYANRAPICHRLVTRNFEDQGPD